MNNSIDDLLAEGYRARREGRPSDAARAFTEAVRLSRESGNEGSLAKSLTGIGQIERDRGDIEAARKHYEDAVEVYRGLDKPLRLAHTIRHVGDILREDGQYGPAAPCYEEALAIYRQHGETSTLDLANAIAGFARLKKQEAMALWREAKSLYESVDVRAGVEEAETQLAALDG